MLPPNLDYPSWVHNTGFWSASPPENWDPPQRLVEFLDHDPAPIYIWFGSIVGSDPSKTARIIVDAVKRLGVRAVVARGGSGIAFPEEKDPSIYYVEQVPFKWLFPRVSAVVHHGGMGTASLALEAGRPQVVCPFVFVHRHTAERMYEIGVSTPPVLQSKMSVDRLSKAISEVLDRNSYADRSATLQKLIAEEDGIAEAVRVLEQIGERGL
ncbi:hypothetical protein GCM10023214_67350 [Amycolatopsis dongchuanensis]|uniref:Erythromycin biosynthesis protein CIII-like C-terminal domain-containing protein n=1 Tax=Amycolatopsis dongchuanensis TaxID=1070866 RepID=A0ABP8VIU2_9PSEU